MTEPLGETNGDRVIAGNFTISAQLPNGKNINIAGYLFSGESRADFNEKLDFAMQSIDRQRLIAEVPELEAKLQQMEDHLESMTVIVMGLEKQGKLNSQQKAQLDNFHVNIPKMKKDISRGQDAIARAKEAAAKAV